MKKTTYIFLAAFALSAPAFASEFQTRYEDAQREAIEQQFKDIDALYNESAARVSAVVNSFAQHHGGFTEQPQLSARRSAYDSGADISFSTADGLACDAWDRCGRSRGGAAIDCYDPNRKEHYFGPKRCSL